MRNRKLIIEIPYGGLGDHLFHSHLPRIAKETGKYDKVFISKKSLFRHPDNMYIVWELNPYIDGFTDEKGITYNIKNIIKKITKKRLKNNLLDEIMLAYGLDDGKRGHEPENYYKPIYNPEYHKVIFDPNFLSWVGEIDKRDMMAYIKRKKIKFDAIMKIRTNQALYIPKAGDDFIETKTLADFCNLIYSCKNLYCLTSGTATLAASLGKPATVFFGENQEAAYQHSKFHNYIKVDRCFQNKLKSFIKKYFYFK